MPRLLVALPAYNEEACLPPLLNSFAKLFAEHPELDGVVIVVDDGSADRTAAVAEKWAKRLPVHVVRHERNKGLGEAIKTGLRTAVELSKSDRDVIVCMDADDTHPPRFIPSMLRKIESGADIVIASRYQRGSTQRGVPLRRQVLSWGAFLVFSTFLRLPGVRDYTCGYRAYRVSLVKKGFERYGDSIIERSGFACTDELLVNLAALGARIREVPFSLRYDRKVGESKIKLGLTVRETFKLISEGRARLRAGKRPR
ncbi:MAG: glycosyltransferase family 2 protein [Candidatus Sumerlaeia bacterium]|nr:glycosyltransferase family 2 protein [Candidatus Sumerlaeia bacterium]